ncbi:MAG: IS21 family transposase, partial [Mesorhizobium sp.]
MRTPEEVSAMLGLRRLGWGTKRIAAELGRSRNTVRRYIEAGGWAGYRKPRRARALEGLEDWLAERFRQHRGNADVVRQELAREHGLQVSLRTVERAVAP